MYDGGSLSYGSAVGVGCPLVPEIGETHLEGLPGHCVIQQTFYAFLGHRAILGVGREYLGQVSCPSPALSSHSLSLLITPFNKEGAGGLGTGLLWPPAELWALLRLIFHGHARGDLLEPDSGFPKTPML